MDERSLRKAGEGIIATFNSFAESPPSANIGIGSRRIGLEAQRFQLWAHSLGLHQQGHAFLDYRLRDSDIVRDRLFEVLLELQEHLDDLLSISKGDRSPVKRDQDSASLSSSSNSSSDSSYVEQNEDNSQDSFDEVAFRLQSITERLDTLYMIATRIRNPKNRPSKTNDQLYGDIASSDRDSYRKEREDIETLTVSYLHRQDLLRALDSQDKDPQGEDSSGILPEELASQYSSAQNWIMKRTGIANARRKQQFVYWKEHAAKLGGKQHPPPRTQQLDLVPDARPVQYETSHVPKSGYIGPSLATSATPLPANTIKPDDMKSVISHQSGFSVQVDSANELPWPAPPKVGRDDKYFQCPYCMTLCPARYLKDGLWQSHLIHDLQPYHCTYDGCQDPHRLYGTRQEWVDHESQHLRVWHCRQHNEEFETQPDFMSHLELLHPEYVHGGLSDQLLDSSIAPSEHVHRDCPYCPSSFLDPLHMRKHIMNHLERFALLALPSLDLDDEVDETQDVVSSNESHDALVRGRAVSVLHDFPGIREIACDRVSIGYVTVNLSFAYYSMDDSTITCFIRSPRDDNGDYLGFRIDYPFDTIRGIRWSYYECYLLLTKPPLFKLLAAGAHTFTPCSDFTYNAQASSILDHGLCTTKQWSHHFTRQMDKLYHLLTSNSLKGFHSWDMEGTYKNDESGYPVPMLPENPVITQINVLEWRRDIQSDDELSHAVAKTNVIAETTLTGAGIDNEDASEDQEDDEGDDEGDDDDSLVCSWLDRSRYTYAQYIYSLEILKDSWEETPPVAPFKKRMDPDCAICHAPGSLRCDCEARYLQDTLAAAEERVMKPIYDNIRAWVQLHSLNARKESFKSLMRTRGTQPNPEVLDEPASISREERLRKWDEACSQDSEIVDYYCSLVVISVPQDDDPAVRFPVRELEDEELLTEVRPPSADLW